ncbi:MAG TPA: hypothetical protein VL443_25940 [Cyclobacteriaceae bacterium]|nr:hypothetical protein [Cyclobacteriaceae bacterium]
MKKELSSTVRKTLECDAFKSWLVVHAYKIQNGRLYEIELKNEDVVQIIKFYANAKIKGG